MIRPGLSLSLAYLVITSVLARGESTPSIPDAKRISGLVSQLGSPRFQEREEAAQQLRGLGANALGALHSAVRNSDPEIRRRAEKAG
jgi:hypothetical protein